MSKRKDHVFRFTGKVIAECAEREATYHGDRAKWWDTEYQRVVTLASEATISVQKFAGTGGERAQLVIDPTIQGRITECETKRASHQAAADRFQIEADAYGTQPDVVFDLDADDVVYFRLAGSERPE